MRPAFVRALTAAAAKDRRIVLLTGDLGYNALEPFKDRFPDRFLNMGLSEQNMVGFAAGLALAGKIPVVYSIATFMTLKTVEQLRNDVCYQGLNVKVVGVGAGLTYSQYGATHHATEDIALMRLLPSMKVICPGDPVEVTGATHALLKDPAPCYLRIGARGEPNIHPKSISFRIGRGYLVRPGKDAVLIATGNMLANTVAAAQILAKRAAHMTVVSMPTVKPLDEALLRKLGRTFRHLFTVEEHTTIGGFGSAVADFLADEHEQPRLHRIALADEFQKTTGWLDWLRAQNGLSPEGIAKTVLRTLKKRS
ncbi:hypothetical protein HYW67_03050 [Candidatus Parcubacteria bacterium]|nr:hypothetical protein [Candidatus Parcubacteria bacterium]